MKKMVLTIGVLLLCPAAYLSLWPVPVEPVCTLSTGSLAAPYVMDDVSQLPRNDDHLYRDPEYSWDAYVQA